MKVDAHLAEAVVDVRPTRRPPMGATTRTATTPIRARRHESTPHQRRAKKNFSFRCPPLLRRAKTVRNAQRAGRAAHVARDLVVAHDARAPMPPTATHPPTPPRTTIRHRQHL